jgi:hypothetical protein
MLSPGLHTPSPWQSVQMQFDVHVRVPQSPHSMTVPVWQTGFWLPPVHSDHTPESPQVRWAPHMQPMFDDSPAQHCAPAMHSPLQTTPPVQVQKPSAQVDPASHSLS